MNCDGRFSPSSEGSSVNVNVRIVIAAPAGVRVRPQGKASWARRLPRASAPCVKTHAGPLPPRPCALSDRQEARVAMARILPVPALYRVQTAPNFPSRARRAVWARARVVCPDGSKCEGITRGLVPTRGQERGRAPPKRTPGAELPEHRPCSSVVLAPHPSVLCPLALALTLAVEVASAPLRPRLPVAGARTRHVVQQGPVHHRRDHKSQGDEAPRPSSARLLHSIVVVSSFRNYVFIEPCIYSSELTEKLR